VLALLEQEWETAVDLWHEGSCVLARRVREARLHAARHTAATFLLVLGVGDRAVLDVVGWSKITMA